MIEEYMKATMFNDFGSYNGYNPLQMYLDSLNDHCKCLVMGDAQKLEEERIELEDIQSALKHFIEGQTIGKTVVRMVD